MSEQTLRDTSRLRMTSDEQDDVEHAVSVLMGSASARCRVAARSLMRLLGRHGVPGYATVHDAAPATRAHVTDAAGISRQGTGDTPTLTDAERKALERQASWLASDESFARDMMRKDAATLRGLLARLGGGA